VRAGPQGDCYSYRLDPRPHPRIILFVSTVRPIYRFRQAQIEKGPDTFLFPFPKRTLHSLQARRGAGAIEPVRGHFRERTEQLTGALLTYTWNVRMGLSPDTEFQSASMLRGARPGMSQDDSHGDDAAVTAPVHRAMGAASARRRPSIVQSVPQPFRWSNHENGPHHRYRSGSANRGAPARKKCGAS
jgi:hypothetical protein